jgi:class 3 adenylate cyclase
MTFDCYILKKFTLGFLIAWMLYFPAVAQQELLERIGENDLEYCDDLVEVCPEPEQVTRLYLTYDLYSGNFHTYISEEYFKVFKQKLNEVFYANQLERLYLEDGFIILPEEIYNLTNLQKLTLEKDSIAAFPPEARKLKNLHFLGLQYLKVIPKNIQYLETLRELYIKGTPINTLPVEITQLHSLQTLVILDNKITEIPPHITTMKGLQTLYISGNLFTVLPPAIGGLKNLKNLYLPSNKITQVAAEIGNLSNLEELNLAYNNLKNLPTELAQLKKLRKLDLRGNTLDNLKINEDLYAFFLKVNNGNNEVVARLMDNYRYSEQIAKEQAVAASLRAENDRVLQLARANEAEAKRKDEEARANKAEAERRKVEAQKAESDLKRERAEKDALLNKEKAQEAESQRLKAENDTKNAELKSKQHELQTQNARQNSILLGIGVGFLLILAMVILWYLRKQHKINALLESQKKEVEIQKSKADALLLNILPHEIAEELKEKGITEVRYFKHTSVLFADVQGFSTLAKQVSPQELIKELDMCFTKFDEVISKYNLERIKTIGDCYMAAGGVPHANTTNPVDIVLAALEIQRWMSEEKQRREVAGKTYWGLRLGIHTGDLVAGVIGKTKFAYDVWGNTVNTASRVESGGEVGRVNITEDTYQYIKDFFVCESRGKIDAKNIGLIETYFVTCIKPEFSKSNQCLEPNADFFKRLEEKFEMMEVS